MNKPNSQRVVAPASIRNDRCVRFRRQNSRPGQLLKLADLIMLDRSPLDPSLPDEDLSTIQVLMTVVGGQVVYDAATYKHPSEAVRLARDGMSYIDNETE